MHNRKAVYTYKDMLNHIMGILHAKNPNLIEKKCRTMKPMQLTWVGNKKPMWVNFQEILLEPSMTGTYVKYPYRKLHGYRALIM
jgi:hypothetical protein